MFLFHALREYYSRELADRRLAANRTLHVEALEVRRLLTLQGNSLFPADSPWNQKIANAPVAANSTTLVASIGASSPLHPDFGTVYQGGNIGIPYNVVSAAQPKVSVVIDAYRGESDLLPVPIPAGAVIEGDPLPSGQNTGDRHLIVYDKDSNIAYELFNVHRPTETSDGQWHADSEAVWDMSKDSFRTPGFTSADAAGLPILPGLVRPDEVLDQGVISHALRFTVPNSNSAFVFPASHSAGVNNPAYPRMGDRFRLKQSFDISGYPADDRVILQALKDYGMIVADNGSGWYLSGSPSSRWSDDNLHRLTAIQGSNFEAVTLSPSVTSLDQTSGSAAGGTAVTIHGQNFSGAAGQLQVRFGGTPASNVTVISDTQIVAMAPAHATGAVHVSVVSPYGTSASSTADQFTYTATIASSAISARWLFYARSPRYDVPGGTFPNVTPGSPFSDDNAIATNKAAYLPNGNGGTSAPATFSNVSSFDRGINGVMIDLTGPHGTISASDFTFKVGNNNTPSSWATPAGVATPTVLVRAGAGAAPNSDRIALLWPDHLIENEWLQVTVKSTPNTNLPAGGDTFFFGSAVADSVSDTTSAKVDVSDELAARNNAHLVADNIPVTNLFDYNRDGAVNVTDQLLARNNQTVGAGVTQFIAIGIPVAAPELAASSNASDGSAVATALSFDAARTARTNEHFDTFSEPSRLTPQLAQRARDLYFGHAPAVENRANLVLDADMDAAFEVSSDDSVDWLLGDLV